VLVAVLERTRPRGVKGACRPYHLPQNEWTTTDLAISECNVPLNIGTGLWLTTLLTWRPPNATEQPFACWGKLVAFARDRRHSHRSFDGEAP
jgi:hypothetical protein